MTPEEPIHRRHRDVAKWTPLGRRIEYSKKGRQEKHAGQKGYSHAAAGDDAELSHANIMRRQERHETGRGRCRSQCQRRSHASARKRQGFPKLTTRSALIAVADACKR